MQILCSLHESPSTRHGAAPPDAAGRKQMMRPAPFHGSIIGFRNRHIVLSLHLPLAMPDLEDLKALGPEASALSQFCATKNSSIKQRGIISRSRRSQPEPMHPVASISNRFPRLSPLFPSTSQADNKCHPGSSRTSNSQISAREIVQDHCRLYL